ncbi:GAF domain-containing protein [Paucibacter soli]|uniref:GAF domain-containing protein n=1 Tax=Paucibacter soli TaxID=3133433 RepID=UPI00309C2F2F
MRTEQTPPSFCASDAELAALQARVPNLPGSAAASAADAGLRLQLAWQLRQRDPGQARAWAETLAAEPAERAPPGLHARLALIRAEALQLQGDYAQASDSAAAALREFTRLRDALGEADARWTLAGIAFEQGEMDVHHAELERMRRAAAEAAEPVRQCIAAAALARAVALSDLAQGLRLWDELCAALAPTGHCAAQCHVNNLLGSSAALRGEFAGAIACFATAYAQALESGQPALAMRTAMNAGSSCNNVNNHQDALEWAQRGLELARRSGSPSSIGSALVLCGASLRFLQRREAARALLDEALQRLASLPGSRQYAIALLHMGEVRLADSQPAEALHCFEQLEQRALALAGHDLLADAWVGQAQALLALGRLPAAARATRQVLDGPSSATQRIAALQLMAALHAQDAELAAPAGMQAASPSLHYLQAALQLAQGLAGYQVPSGLLEALARAHAMQGDTAQAYAYAMQASQARKSIHNQASTKRAIALQVTRETQRVQAEAELERRQAATQQQRGELLQQANATLERLAAMGRDIVGQLDETALCETLHRQTQALLDAHTFAVYRLRPDGLALQRIFGREAGRPLGERTQALDDADSHAARCARERREIVLHVASGTHRPVAGTQETLSMMFAPMLVGQRLLGVLTIQSPQAQAYAERELAILRSLGAYAAIGLANAETLQRLRHTQALLLQQEKLAALGQWVAGIGAEIETPMDELKSGGRRLGAALDRVMAQLPDLLCCVGGPPGAATAPPAELERQLALIGASAAQVKHAADRAATIVQALKTSQPPAAGRPGQA